MKKVGVLILVLISAFMLVSCKKDYSQYAGTYVLSSQSFLDKNDRELTPFVVYEIELTSKGKAHHKLKLNVMESQEEFSNSFSVNESKNLIYFKNIIGFMQTYTDTWAFRDGQIIMKDVLVSIVSNPDPSEEGNYASGIVILTKKEIN